MANEDEAKKIIAALVEYWHYKVLERMQGNRLTFDEALEIVIREIHNG